MSAGRMSERLTVQTLTDSTDAIGGKTPTVATLATIAAEVIPLRSDERLQHQGIGTQTDYRFRVYSRADLTTKRRISWTPRWPRSAATVSLEIHGVYQEPSRATMILDCGVYS